MQKTNQPTPRMTRRKLDGRGAVQSRVCPGYGRTSSVALVAFGTAHEVLVLALGGYLAS